MGKIETVVNCCSYFSDSDIISSEWNEQSTLDKYTASLTSRALMFYLYSEAVSSHKWRPFHKPQWYSSFKTHKEYSNELKYIFKNWRTNTRVLQTDILPYVVKIPYFEYSKGQKEFVRKAIKFNYPKYNTRPKMDNLTEKDIFEDNITEDNDYNCAVTLSENINDDAEENIIIEDDYS
ncbi:cell cycle checkpoint protein RAD17-like [Centruroides sculpturatus]|nr:cell cycle checkpoint protein RAD17-like [Centruroides sculpturatus]